MYVSAIPASIFSGDDGETVTASLTLGIQHPPGYPLFSLIGKLFSLVPAGDISFRVCLMSAFFATLNLLLISVFFKRLAGIAGVKNPPLYFLWLPSLIYASGFSIFQQSIIAKGGIYTLNNFFTILMSITLLEAYFSFNKAKWFILFSLLFGLSLGNHLMIQAITLPAYAFLLFRRSIFRRLGFSGIAMVSFVFISGLFIYSYLPVRAVTAVLNWGDPSTPANFLEVITRSQYMGAEIAKSAASVLRQAGKFFSSLAYSHLFVLPLLAIAGAFFLYKASKHAALFLLAIPLFSLLAVSFYLNLEKDRLYIMETYITPVYFPLSVLICLGVYYLFGLTKNFPVFRATAAFSLLVFILQAAYFYPKLDKSRYFCAYDYNRNLLSTAEERSIIFLTGDGVVFPCWYLQHAKGFRTDLTLAGTAVLPMKWVRDGITRHNPSVRMPNIRPGRLGAESTGYIIDAMIRLNAPLFRIYFAYNKPEANALAPGLTLVPKGMLYAVLPEAAATVTDNLIAASKALWSIYSLRSLHPEYKRYGDDKSRDVYITDYSVSLNQAGTFMEDRSFFSLSLMYFKMAQRVKPLDHEYVYNIGNAYYNLGDYGSALDSYRKSLELRPSYENSWFNMGVTYYTLKKYDEAIQAFERVLKINPDRADVMANIRMIRAEMNGAR